MSTTTVPTVASIREGLNKAGVSERKVARLSKQLEEAQAEHAANIAAVGLVPAAIEAEEDAE